MKRNIYISLLVAAIALLSGCGKGFLTDLANNPNQPSQAPLPLVLPPLLSGYAANIINGHITEGLWMGYFSYSGGYSVTNNDVTYYVSQSSPGGKGSTGNPDGGVTWDGLFPVITNANYMEQTAASQKNMEYYVAVAKILKAYGYQILVDAYGNVPYTEAFKGTNNFFPKYDDGKTVYTACILQLDSAINIINTADQAIATSLGSNDVMFQGDMSKWAKFANTLKLRFLLRAPNVVSDVKGEIAKTASFGYLTQDALVNPGYLNSAGKQSPLWADLGVSPGGSVYSDGYNYIRGGGAAVDFYKHNNDPRLFYVFAPDGSDPSKPAFLKTDTVADHYHGVYYGDRTAAAAQNNPGTVGVGHGVMPGYSASVPLITAAESFFLQTEAAQRGLTDSVAKDLYNAGITASFEYLYTQAGDSKSNADAAAKEYYTQSKDLINWESSSNKIETIIVQKWAALAITNNFEAWTEYRRTGFPNTDVLPETKFTTSRHIPAKFMYPKSEADRNKDAYNEAVSKGNDPQSTKIFWMQ